MSAAPNARRTRRTWRCGVTVVAAAWTLSLGVAAARASTVAPAVDAPTLIAAVNADRAAVGAGEVVDAADLDAVATAHAADMAAAGVLQHNAQLGTQVTGWLVLGENVGVGDSIEQVHEAWLASAGHRKNIEDTRFSEVGIGIISSGGHVWAVEVFRQPETAASATSEPRVVATSTTGAATGAAPDAAPAPAPEPAPVAAATRPAAARVVAAPATLPVAAPAPTAIALPDQAVPAADAAPAVEAASASASTAAMAESLVVAPVPATPAPVRATPAPAAAHAPAMALTHTATNIAAVAAGLLWLLVFASLADRLGSPHPALRMVQLSWRSAATAVAGR